MKSRIFRQGVACAVMITVLFGTVAPAGACWCPGCHCENSVNGLVKADEKPQPATEPSCCSIKKCCRDKKICCCAEVVDDSSSQTDDAACCCEKDSKNCCGCGQQKGKCLCGHLQKAVAVTPDTVSPVQKLMSSPTWDMLIDIVSPADEVGGLMIFLEHQHLRRASPVPLHVLLCVFLN
jgi:hypothetical protein